MVVRDLFFYEFFLVEIFGRERIIYVDCFVGREMICFYLFRFGIYDEEIIEEFFRRVKVLRRFFIFEMLVEEVRRMMI